MRFLVADDSRLSRKKLSMLIEELGHEVVAQAEDGAVAIEMYKEHKPDYITMDLEMPNMKGDESSKHILEMDKDVNIILITSIVDKKELVNVIKLGVKKVMQKPVTEEKLRLAIEELQQR
ncbi:MAG: response regulator [Campylobacterota bacterium]|nr:response regulator [Campylobacterota bacterium]